MSSKSKTTIEYEQYVLQQWDKENPYQSKLIDMNSPFVLSDISSSELTGELHMGHMLNLTVQDILCRWQRLKGAQYYGLAH